MNEPEVDLYSKGMPGIWHVAFYSLPDAPPAWWERFSPFGFRHVLAFGFSVYSDRWMVYDVTRDRTIIMALHAADFTPWLAGLPEHRRILRLPLAVEPRASKLRLGFWCTRAVAHLLGIPSRALRPHGLYRELQARGAVPAFVPAEPD